MERLCIGGPKDGQHVTVLNGHRMNIAGEQPDQWSNYDLWNVKVNGVAVQLWVLAGLSPPAVVAGLERHHGAPIELDLRG